MTTLKLDKPIVFFDLETTGLMIEIDKIIEIGLLKINTDGTQFRLSQRFDPGIKIPIESSAIHGIYNKDLAGLPKFSDHAASLFDIFGDSDLGGYNIKRFDIAVLKKEFESAGYKFYLEGRRIVDASVIFREMEPRTLSAAYKFFVGKELEGAHGAAADIDATYAVFLAQMERYPQLPRDIQGIHEFCSKPNPNWVDFEGRLVWRDGAAFFSFGKYKYRSLEDVSNTDPGYLEWLCRQENFHRDFVHICQNALKGYFPQPNRTQTIKEMETPGKKDAQNTGS